MKAHILSCSCWLQLGFDNENRCVTFRKVNTQTSFDFVQIIWDRDHLKEQLPNFEDFHINDSI